jgi:hypothetical protein
MLVIQVKQHELVYMTGKQQCEIVSRVLRNLKTQSWCISRVPCFPGVPK